MELLGTIKQVQIQRENLKLGETPNRVYHTDPLLVVDSLKLTSRGVLGVMMDGAEIIDVHHIDHPGSRNRGNENGLSMNFTAHYGRMRGQYGEHLAEGVAGENILVNFERIITMEELGTKLAIENADTKQLIYLERVRVAEPCVEFSHFVLQERAGGEKVKETLQFIGDGIRGFYMALADGQNNPTIQAGDRVYTLHD